MKSAEENQSFEQTKQSLFIFLGNRSQEVCLQRAKILITHLFEMSDSFEYTGL